MKKWSILIDCFTNTYCYVCEESNRDDTTIDYNIENLKNDQLFFQSPEKFNDPYDCFLGFSQTQIIKDLMTHELKRKHIYNEQTKAILNQFFNTNVDDYQITEADFDDNVNMEFFQSMVDVLFDNTNDNFFEDANEVKEVLNYIFLSSTLGKQLLVKSLNNALTIKDNHDMVDLLYKCSEFKVAIKRHSASFEDDTMFECVARDAHLKIENGTYNLWDDSKNKADGIDIFSSIIKYFIPQSAKIDSKDIVDSFEKISKETLQKSRDLIASQFKITCLSETPVSSLMWSHYANKHIGFCLEYDFTQTYPFIYRKFPDLTETQLMLFPVRYSEERPLLSKYLFDSKTKFKIMKDGKIPPKLIENIVQGLLCKSSDWEYEKEWRIIKIESKTAFARLPKPTKILLGANIESFAKIKLIEIAATKNIPVYQMSLTPDKYKLKYNKI